MSLQKFPIDDIDEKFWKVVEQEFLLYAKTQLESTQHTNILPDPPINNDDK